MAKASKPKSFYACSSCGHREAKWLGRCPACGEWNTIVEETERAVMPATTGVADGVKPVAMTSVPPDDVSTRLRTGLGEVDRVLGGGFMAGSLVLLGGDPGVGKSTLLTQMMGGLATRGARVLYAAGEESVAQTAARAERLGAKHERHWVVAETDIDRIIAHAKDVRPALLAIDSIQTAYCAEIASLPGSVAQVRETTGRVLAYAKTSGVPVMLVGHVTKDGVLAGPKTLEHLVDVVLQFESDGGALRRLRGQKNRFGSTDELGVFEMSGKGLLQVENPSAHLLKERAAGAPGSVVVSAMDGQRPMLVEVQALVAPATAGLGRRTAAGVDSNRVALLLAVLAQRAGLNVLADDVFVNVAGGVRLSEPAADLGVALAIASSARGRAMDPKTVVFGELGLAGEVRSVPFFEQRLLEAARLGFTRAIVPKQSTAKHIGGLELVCVERLSRALET